MNNAQLHSRQASPCRLACLARPLGWAGMVIAATACAVWLAACGGGLADAAVVQPLWSDDGRAKLTLREDWPADAAAHWSGQRYATAAQLDSELLLVAPYSLVIDADDEAALADGLRRAESVQAFSGGKPLLGVFARSRQPALAARLAERLAFDQGWENVFVVH